VRALQKKIATGVLQKDANSLSHLPDGQLVQRALQGNDLAFEVLVHRYSSGLFQKILSCLGDYDVSCDVFQQVLVQLYRSLPSLNYDSSLKPWLSHVARHKIIDEVRRRRSVPLSGLEETEEQELLLSLVDPAFLPEELLEYRELQRQVKEAIASLPEKYQRVVELRYLTQMSFSEIGRLIGIPQATAKTHFQRAKPLLRAIFQTERLGDYAGERGNQM
jgi:RNA polymerase sigma factor (sigma-70 family)